MILTDPQLFTFIDNTGIAVFAATGAIAAARKKMDLIGILVLSIVTAVGGGTVRDLLTGETPVAWLRDARFISIAAATGIFIYALGHFVALKRSLLLVPDAVGLALYTWIGCEKTLALGLPWTSVLLIGMITGTAGGILRDVLSGEIPIIFVKSELYATASIVGGIVFLFCKHYAAAQSSLAAFACVSAVLALRLAALHWTISLPVYQGSVKD
jgi:uncharacterized membrane protein YeiH